MSLGSQIAPWIPAFRGYATSLAGDRALGDMLIRRALDSIVEVPESFPRGMDVQLGFARQLEIVARELVEKGAELPDGSVTSVLTTGGRISLVDRKIALSSVKLGFTPKEIGYIIDYTAAAVEQSLERTAGLLGRVAPRSVVICEPEPIIAEMLSFLVRGEGHNLIGVASSEDAAIRLIAENDVSLIITETRLPNGISGDSLIQRIRSTQAIDALIFTGTPSDHFINIEASYVASVVGKPSPVSAIRIGLHVALGGAGLAANIPPVNGKLENDIQLAILDAEPVDFAPAISVDGQAVRLVRDELHASTSMDRLDALRVDHAEEARRLLDVGYNIGISFSARLRKLTELLDQPLSDETALRIANQAQALASFQRVIEEELLPLQAADMLSFIRSVEQFTRQFPAWREFLMSAELTPAVNSETMQAAQDLAAALTNVPDVISDEVREVVSEANSVQADVPSELGQRYFIGVIRNVYAAIAKWGMARASGTAKRFNDQFDEKIGDALLEAFGNLILLAGAPLAVLATTLPKEFVWVGPALAAFRTISKKGSG